MQDAVECDAIAKTGFVLNFAMKGLEKPNDTLLQLKGKCSSRVWQKIFDVVYFFFLLYFYLQCL